ncbi:MAG: hypothetical protein K0R26_2394 [Bacteroidota bacterium]|jgi:hypothetical protein|nr:hypothetical protein [Bacteroidota bacterium]
MEDTLSIQKNYNLFQLETVNIYPIFEMSATVKRVFSTFLKSSLFTSNKIDFFNKTLKVF